MDGILFPKAVPEGRESLQAYRARGGYEALVKAVKGTPEDIIKVIADSGLRGHGGAGFPVGKKWQFTREAPEQPRYLVMNGGEDEPGSRKDRILLENLPHLVIEGTILGAFAIGAAKAYLYINAKYDIATQTIKEALTEAKSAGYWGEKILGSAFSLDVEIVPAPHNYVAGEDTAVIEVIEGKKPLPRQKPPFPVTVGLFGKPTAVNNVETLANVPRILLKGAQWYRSYGTADCPGTMLFSLNETEEVNRPGIYELPFGTPLKHLIEVCGGGMKAGQKIKAIMPASPSSAYLAPDKLDTPLEPNAMRDAGSALGCGVVHIVREGVSIVDELVRITEFFAAESCAQCPACQMETKSLLMLMKKVQQGQGNAAMLEQFGKLLAFNKGKGFCNLIGMPGPPIESALRLFPEDFQSRLASA